MEIQFFSADVGLPTGMGCLMATARGSSEEVFSRLKADDPMWAAKIGVYHHGSLTIDEQKTHCRLGRKIYFKLLD